jgi:hypothetical protein
MHLMPALDANGGAAAHPYAGGSPYRLRRVAGRLYGARTRSVMFEISSSNGYLKNMHKKMRLLLRLCMKNASYQTIVREINLIDG